MLRRQFLRWIAVGFALCIGLFVSPVQAQSGVASLQETLEKGLKARRPVEFEFIAEVIEFVELGALKRDRVMACFEYARRRNENQPMRYFIPAMRIEAKRVGVDL